MHERKVKVDGGLWKAYQRYKQDKIAPVVDRTTYTKICKEFNKALSHKIITESFEYKIPFGLGYLRIKASRQKIRVKDGKVQTHKMAINWNETWNLWNRLYPNKTRSDIKNIPDKKLVVHINEHTDGYIMRWYWDKRVSNFKNQTVYQFRPVKGGKSSDNIYTGRLGLSAWINSDDRNNEYYE